MSNNNKINHRLLETLFPLVLNINWYLPQFISSSQIESIIIYRVSCIIVFCRCCYFFSQNQMWMVNSRITKTQFVCNPIDTTCDAFGSFSYYCFSSLSFVSLLENILGQCSRRSINKLIIIYMMFDFLLQSINLKT